MLQAAAATQAAAPEPEEPKKRKGAGKGAGGGEGAGAGAGNDAEACEAKEPLEVAKTVAAKLLKTATDARKGWQELQRKPLAERLCAQLKDYEQKSQAAYEKITALMENNVNDMCRYQPYLDSVKPDLHWFEDEGRGVLEGFKRTLLKSTKPKAKKKAATKKAAK